MRVHHGLIVTIRTNRNDMYGLLFIAISQLECQVGVLCHSTSSTRALGVSLLHAAIVRVMHDVVHTPHSSLCTGTSLFNLHSLLFAILSPPIHTMCPYQRNMASLDCPAFNVRFSTTKSLLFIFVAPLLSAPRCHCVDSPKHSQLQL